MFSRIFGRNKIHEVPIQLYASVVQQSRSPVFFTDYGFADTVTGRLDVLLLHLYLFSRRLVREDTAIAQSLNQETFDLFSDDLDRSLRELGVGDTSVPKRKKKMVRSFYALIEQLSSALDQKDGSLLADTLKKRFVDEDPLNASSVKSRDLADYVLATAAYLDNQKGEDLLKGQLSWPEAPALTLTNQA